MKALSLTQPWATLVVTGEKLVETRGWRPPSWILNRRIAIHASKGMPGWAKEAAYQFSLDPDTLPRGAVIGSVVIVKVEPTERAWLGLTETEKAMGDYSAGRFAWFLSGAQQHEPIPATGALGFWDWHWPDIAQLPATFGLSDGHAE